MRKTIAIFMAVFLCCACVIINAGAVDASPRVFVDGIDADPARVSFVLNGSTYVPLRSVSEALGATVVIWDPNTETAEVESEGVKISGTCGEKYIVANERYLFVHDGCIAVDGWFMVPVRTLALAFGASVTWDKTGKVYIAGGGEPIKHGADFYNSNDLYWLSRIINAEACGECLEGKIAVGNVVLNRVADASFPNTVKGVIFDKSYGVQFTPAYSGAIYNDPSDESVIAAKLALEGTDVVGDCLYFTASYAAVNCWAAKNREFVAQIDNQVFFS